MFFPLLSTALPLLSLAATASAIQPTPGGNEQTTWDKLGNLSPYHVAPAANGVTADLPADCTVEQVMLMGRHGSRYPLVTELPFIQNLTYQLGNHSDAIQKAKLPANLQFLKKGYTTSLGVNDLTVPGRQQLFAHGVNFRLKYPDLLGNHILAGSQDRVVESAQRFAQGYFGRSWSALNSSEFSTLNEDNETVSWITPMYTCADWDYKYNNYGINATITWDTVYLPPITKRLNALLPGVGLVDTDTHGALYACAYDLAAYGASPWCDVFTQEEIGNFGYELDLLTDGVFGYGLPGMMGPVIGSLYVNTLIERFTDSSGNASAVYLEFGHDTTIDQALTGLGLAKDSPPLSAKGPAPANRKWLTANQVPFGAQMIWEKFTCTSSFSGPQIRLVLNEATFPLTTCTQSKVDRTYGTCSMVNFVNANKNISSITWGDSTWNASCGVSA